MYSSILLSVLSLLGSMSAHATCDVGDGDVCVDTTCSGTDCIDCDLSTASGSSDTSLLIKHDSFSDEYIFGGVDESGREYECRFDDWSAAGGIDPDDYAVVVYGTEQADDVEFETYFTAFRFTAYAGNDRAIQPDDCDDVDMDMGDGDDWITGWIDERGFADMGNGNDVVEWGTHPASRSIINGGAGEDCVRTGSGSEQINGGDDDDTLDGGMNTNSVNGDAGIDECRNGPVATCEVATPAFVCPAYSP